MPVYQIRECEIPGCDRPVRAGNMCKVHYTRKREGRDMNAPIRVVDKPVTRVCKIEGCGRPHASHGYCGGHHYRWKNGLDLDAPWSGTRSECDVPGCDRNPKARGLCATHYQRLMSTGDVRADDPIVKKYDGPKREGCTVPGCGLPHVASGLCRRHVNWRLNYGATDEVMAELQGRPCAICGATGTPHLDHDHECCPGTGYGGRCGTCIRGVLCERCNKAIGLFDDRAEILGNAIRYLETWKTDRSVNRDLGYEL